MLKRPALWFTCVVAVPSQAVSAQVPVTAAFEVASVKPNMSNAPATSLFPLGPGDAYVPNGGRFSAKNQPLIVYLRFAYRLGQGDLLGLPTWVYDDRFEIEARALGNPTKDQVRLMMRSLLAERFKLITRTERQTKAVFNLVLARTGQTGPQLQVHVGNEPCTAAPSPSQAPGSVPSGPSGSQLPSIPCGSIGQVTASAPNRGRIVGRGVTMDRIAGFLTNPFTGVDRRVFDRTGLPGIYDFSLEWSLIPDTAQPPDPAQPRNSLPDDAGPAFPEALQKQLGLKLISATGPVDVLVVDHVEHPTEN